MRGQPPIEYCLHLQVGYINSLSRLVPHYFVASVLNRGVLFLLQGEYENQFDSFITNMIIYFYLWTPFIVMFLFVDTFYSC